MMSIHIRHINLETDIDCIHQLTTELGYPSPLSEFIERMQILHQQPTYSTFVIEFEKKIVGYLGAIQQYSWQYHGFFYRIEAFVINEKFRHLGIGQRMLHFFETYAKAKGATHLFLNSGQRPERERAHLFYQRYGFQATSVGFFKAI